MPDPFDFLTTRVADIGTQDYAGLQALNSPDLPEIHDLSLTPKVNADGSNDAFDKLVNNIGKLPYNAPLYTYGEKEAKRYDQPGLQFTPGKLITGGDIEDLYAKNQSAGRQLLNASVKMLANTAGTFTSSFLTIPSTIDLVRQGKVVEAFHDDSLFAGIQNWLTNIEDEFPNYYTEWEREHPYLSAVSPSGMANFWGDKIFKNIGFSVGALAAGLVQDAMIEAATGGGATPAVFINLAKQLERFGGSLFKGFRGLSKAAQMERGAEEIFTLAKVGRDLNKSIETASTLSGLSNASRFALTSYLSAQGEAFIEGFHNYVDTKSELYKQALDGKLSPDQMAQMEKIAQDSARWTTGVNIALLSISNAIQFPKLLGGRGLYNQFEDGFIKQILSKEGVQLASDYSAKKVALMGAKELGKDFITEGFEEGGQYIIGNSLHDYYADRFNPDVRKGLMSYVIDQFSDPELYQEAIIGGLSGALMGGIHTFKKVKGMKQSTEQVVEHMNRALDKFNSTASLLGNINTYGAHEDSSHGAFKNLFNVVESAKRYGTYEVFMDAMNDLRMLPLAEYNKTFGTEFTQETQKLDHLDNIVHKSNEMSDIIDNVNNVYRNNPYKSNSYLVQKIKDAFSVKTDLEVNRQQEYLFNEFKTAMAYNYAKVPHIENHLVDIKNGLKAFGYSNESMGYLINLVKGDRKAVDNYLTYKQLQLDALKKEQEYLSTFLKETDIPLQIEGTNTQDTKKNVERIKKSITRIENLLKKVDQLSKGFTKDSSESALSKEREQLLDLLIDEETFSEDVARYTKAVKEEQKKKIEDAANLQYEKQNLETEQQNPEQTAETLIDVVEEGNNDMNPDLVQEKSLPKVPEENLTDKFNKGDLVQFGDRVYKVTGFNPEEDQVILRFNRVPYILEKKGDKYTLTNHDNGQSKEFDSYTKIDQMENVEDVGKVFEPKEEEKEKEEETKSETETVTPNNNQKKFTISEQEYTKEDVKNNPGRFFVKSSDIINSEGTFFAYSFVDTLNAIRKVQMSKGYMDVIEGRIRFTGSTLKNDTKFRELIFEGTKPLSKVQQEQDRKKTQDEVKQPSSVEENIKSFLGKEYDEVIFNALKKSYDEGKIDFKCK